MRKVILSLLAFSVLGTVAIPADGNATTIDNEPQSSTLTAEEDNQTVQDSIQDSNHQGLNDSSVCTPPHVAYPSQPIDPIYSTYGQPNMSVSLLNPVCSDMRSRNIRRTSGKVFVPRRGNHYIHN